MSRYRGVDRSGVIAKFNNLWDNLSYAHGSTKSGGAWKEVEALLKAVVTKGTSMKVTETESGVRFEIIHDQKKKREEAFEGSL